MSKKFFMELKMVRAVNNYRYERKFFISEMSKYEIESLVKFHPAIFSEIYHQRFVNNIYFDSVNLTNYFDNVVGSARRVKFRIRWYGELFGLIEKPALELKIKQGLVGRKESFSLIPFELDHSFSMSIISNVINKSEIPENMRLKLKSTYPTLLNRYSRRYFQSADMNYRITIDTDLVFYRINCQNNSFIGKFIDKDHVIVELKYNQNMDDRANYITNYFPFRLSKISKYVSGLEKIGF